MENSKNRETNNKLIIGLTMCPVCNTLGLFVINVPENDYYIHCNNCHYLEIIRNSTVDNVISAIENIKAEQSKS